MISFQTPSPDDLSWVRSLLWKENLPLCNYSFPVLFCWKDAFGVEYAPWGGRLLVRMGGKERQTYLWPAGSGDPTPALDAITQEAHENSRPLRLYGLTPYHKNWLEWRYPGRFQWQAVRDGYDYTYSIDRLADLPGKKLHAKRNHIHRLDEHCPGWTFSPIEEEDLPDCLALDRAWRAMAEGREGEEGRRSLDQEHHALILALRHRTQLQLVGIALRWQGELLGFSLGSFLTERVFDVHFERARNDVQGAYPAINRCFAQYIRQQYPQVLYFNREEDMGIPGLRKAKLSYDPDHLQVKFSGVETHAAAK